MKAFLLYRDRDFDPRQHLAANDRELRVNRSAAQQARLEELLPWNAKTLTQDLGLDILFDAMAHGDSFLFEVAKVALICAAAEPDPDTILYRQGVFRDCASHEPIVRDIYRIAIEAIEQERRNYLSFFRHPSGTLHRAVDVLKMFVSALKRLRRIADRDGETFASEGFTRLFAMLRQELSDEYFAVIEDHLQRAEFRGGVLMSAKLGQGNKGVDYVLRRPGPNQRRFMARLLPARLLQPPPGHSFRLHPRDEAGTRALSELRDQGINLVANVLAQSADHILSFFQMLRTELAFYIGCLNLQRRLDGLGQPTCLPVAAPVGARTLAFSGLYDVCLALRLRQGVVGNDLHADGKDLFVITGANSGGKSTFLRSLGLAQLMMQAGMVVAADGFAAEVRDGIFTHFKREEDATMASGKLDEELGRMSDIVDRITPRSMVLFNESFAATNEREGSEIARQITSALVEAGIKVFVVTHLHAFARGVHDRTLANATFLRAERRPDGRRTFRQVEGAPLQTSHGKDLYDAMLASPRSVEGFPVDTQASVSRDALHRGAVLR